MASTDQDRPRRHLLMGAVERALGVSDSLAKHSPLFSAVYSSSCSIALPFLSKVQPLVESTLALADDTVDKLLDRSQSVASSVQTLRKTYRLRSEKTRQFVARACEAWTQLHGRAGPVSFAELQEKLKAVYQDSLGKPVDQLVKVVKDSSGESIPIRLLKLRSEAFAILMSRLELVVSLT